jgi:hypothetical protein
MTTDVKLPFQKDELGNLHLENSIDYSRNKTFGQISSRNHEEKVTYDSRYTGDVEKVSGIDVESLYEIELINYLKGIYYERTKENLGKEMIENLLDISINE